MKKILIATMLAMAGMLALGYTPPVAYVIPTLTLDDIVVTGHYNGEDDPAEGEAPNKTICHITGTGWSCSPEVLGRI